MAQNSFSSEWLKTLSDPYAVLGLSVSADDRRVLKRYRIVAKQLHPDVYQATEDATKSLAGQILARLVNPAYQKLKQDSGRAEVMATLRFRVRRAAKDAPIAPQGSLAKRLLTVPSHSLETFYEEAIASLIDHQYQALDQFEATTLQLGELNLVYLQLKMGEPLLREKRSGIVPKKEAQPIQFASIPTEERQPELSYAQRHYHRAQEYIKKKNWSMAVQELRDAIRLEPEHGQYHAVLARVYLVQNLQGMAKVHFRQALKLDPENPLALKYAEQVNLTVNGAQPAPKPTEPQQKRNGLLGIFSRKR
ncbi:MAG: DnaJ domain-containing protein [Synechococcales cyanobacterium K44_A2020_017]|nr:DnaJ domain-containing protein [Synechococcales cyanobacterium K32_A2020_035]MBF2095167.1 DnaJ domain-containing protein [Synechococcales cyanobacterium K44_A2020_017]